MYSRTERRKLINTARLNYWSNAGWTTRLFAVSPYKVASAAVALLATAIATSAGWQIEPVGDGALHVDLSRQIAGSFSLNTEVVSNYPPLYHIFGAIGHAIAGPSGVQAISFVSFGVMSWFTFLLIRELTQSQKAALAAQGLVSLSPVLIWYSSLTLMEPMLVATVVAALYFVLRAKKEKTLRSSVYAAIALAAVALTKQTGVPVVVASLIFLALPGNGTLPSFAFKRTAIIGFVVVVIAAGPYVFIYSQTGAFTDTGNAPLSQIENTSWPASTLTGDVVDKAPAWSVELDMESDSIALYEQGTVLHEARQVYWKNLTDWSRFNWIHTLYPTSFSGYNSASISIFHWVLNISFVAGLITAFISARRSRNVLLILLVLGFSYVAMSWGTDSKRLFLYVPVISAVLVVLPYVYWWRKRSKLPVSLKDRLHRVSANHHARTIGAPVVLVALTAISLAAILPLVSAQFRTLDDYNDTQGGGFDAVGGVNSIREAGEWMNGRLLEDEAFVAASVYEWEYYTERPDLWDEGLDYRLYFLPADRIDHYLNTAGARYVVIRLNQVMEDDAWNHIERVPVSFVEKLESQYPLAYTTTYGDIKIFEVLRGQEATDA